MCQLTEFLWQAVETIFSKSASMASSGLERKHCPILSYCFVNYSWNVWHWKEQTDLYSHLHTQRSPSAVSAPLPPAQAPRVAPGCSACSSTLQGSADRLRSSANTSGQHFVFVSEVMVWRLWWEWMLQS